MVKEICFDMDGTIADLYSVVGWLDYIENEDVTPYVYAQNLVDMRELSKQLNRLQRNGYKIKIISWLSKTGSPNYKGRIIDAKRLWLKQYLPKVNFDEIIIVDYGTPKQTLGNGILFDDEKANRDNWLGIAYDTQNILEILKKL